jgi:hypothetical protein
MHLSITGRCIFSKYEYLNKETHVYKYCIYVQKLISAMYENVVYNIVAHEGHLSKNTISAVQVCT